MVALTRQDVQSVIDNSRNRLLERVATRQDVQSLQDTIRTLTGMLQQSQQLQRQAEYQQVQLVRRAAATESRMAQVENELRNVRGAMNHLSQNRPTERVTERVIMAQSNNGGSGQRRYIYNPL
jgi:predicted mannosyl-3-phosphoglycerate phosphatase (HAD superfamily)